MGLSIYLDICGDALVARRAAGHVMLLCGVDAIGGLVGYP